VHIAGPVCVECTITTTVGIAVGQGVKAVHLEAVNELPNWRRGEVPASPDRIGQVDFPV